jgi:hypothetical protein
VAERVALSRLKPAPWNPRLIKDARFANLCKSIEADPGFLERRPILAMADGTIYAGNMRYRAVAHLGWPDVPAEVEDIPEQLAKERALRDNAAWGENEDQALAEMLYGLQQEGSALDLLGFEDDEIARLLESVGANGDTDPASMADGGPPRPSLSDRFLVPPFSVLDARQGYWQERKRAWLALGIESELGRGENALGLSAECDAYRDGSGDYSKSGAVVAVGGAGGLVAGPARQRGHAEPGGSRRPAASLGPDGKTVRGDGKGRPADAATLATGDARGTPGGMVQGMAASFNARPPHGPTVTQNPDGTRAYRPTNNGDGTASGTSIFDPVLCELAYTWFCPPGGAVLDPFAGGSVRGIVASKLGRHYTGIDLRPEQIAANAEQAARITPEAPPRWLVGDSLDIAALAPGSYDLLFSCPPYADLERYSDDPRDISTLDYPAFLAAYRAIVAASVGLLAPDRFACFVVGDVRDKRGLYRGFVPDTIAAFRDAGAALYNEAILVTSVGSLPIRVGKQFESGRKLGKTHQNVLIFIKGDPRKATEACGPVDVYDPAEQFGEVVEG